MPRELKAHRIMREIAEKYVELKQHQKICKHTKAVGEYGSDTGNWCEQDDKYWDDVECPTCLARWRYTGDQRGYGHYPRKK